MNTRGSEFYYKSGLGSSIEPDQETQNSRTKKHQRLYEAISGYPRMNMLVSLTSSDREVPPQVKRSLEKTQKWMIYHLTNWYGTRLISKDGLCSVINQKIPTY